MAAPARGKRVSVRWRRGRGRSMIQDRRGRSLGGFGGRPRFGGLGGGFGGGFGLPSRRGRSGFSLGALLLVGIVIAVLFFSGVLRGSGESGRQAGTDADAQLVDFLGFVVEDVQLEWVDLFRDLGRTYQETDLVIFEDSTETGCGLASSQTGPFYCPADRMVYLDLGFFRELRDRFGAPGDFAQAYVIAHEFGHHVQTLLGTEERVRREQQRFPREANELSVRLELQADCYAGVWANTAAQENLLEPGDLEEGLAAAAAVGDDRIQRSAGQEVNPESWTHGSSAQRVEWFREGFADGELRDCDTFSASL
ncbi:MAG TPA: neutral zinc metallopeptidase [Actinomycetota bacterium]|nr:neutral zinc metallopeptidase [Actinomycetota bacterium]